MLGGCGEKEALSTVCGKLVQLLWKTAQKCPQKTKNRLTIGSINITPGQRTVIQNTKEPLAHPHYCSTVHNSQSLETAQMLYN
jgi:hypothetical protein